MLGQAKPGPEDMFDFAHRILHFLCLLMSVFPGVLISPSVTGQTLVISRIKRASFRSEGNDNLEAGEGCEFNAPSVLASVLFASEKK